MKDKRRYPLALYLIMCTFLLAVQSVQLISIHTFSPDFMLILSVIFSLFLGPLQSQMVAFVLGVLLDLMGGGIFGLNAFIFTAAAFSGVFRRLVKMPGIIVFFLYMTLTTIFKYIVYALFYFLLENVNLFDLGYLLKIPGEILLNLLMGLLIYIIFARIDNREHYEWF